MPKREKLFLKSSTALDVPEKRSHRKRRISIMRGKRKWGMRVSETETFILLPVVQWSHGPPPPPPPHTPPPTLIPLLPLFTFFGGRGVG